MASESGEGGRLRLVTDVLRSFADATTDYARLLQSVADGVSSVVGLTCSVRLLTADRNALRTAAIHDVDGDNDLVPALASKDIPITAEARIALDSPRAFVQKIHTQQSVNSAHPDAYDRLQLREVLIAPLIARGAALGLLFVSRRGPGDDTFTQDDIDLVEALASHGALAIANARLLTSLESVERARAHERSILDTVAAPLLLVDKERKIIGINRAFLQTFELADADAIGRSVFEVAEGAFRGDKMHALLAELPPIATVDGVEFEVVTPIGLRTFLVRTKKTFRPGNGSETTLITLIDLTDRKLAEGGARRRAMLVRAMSEALVGIDARDIVTEWNPAAERLFGWTATEAIGQSINDVFAIYEGPRTRSDNRRDLAQGGTIRSRSRIKNKNDVWVDVEYSMMPLVAGDSTTGYVVVLLDVTKRLELESDLRARLEQLTQANSELESFSYSVSHDLRAPVRAIDGFSEILEEEHGNVLDEEGRRMLALVRKNAKRMGLLIDDILALSRFSRQPLVTQKIDIDALARATLDDALRAEPTRKITPTFSTSPLPPIFGDESLLRQVWVNLFTNAVKYTRGRDEALIDICAAETDTEIVYTVKDNGAGFDMRYADKLFGVFERLHSMKDFEGTGIGLALVQRIVKRHAGRVWGEGEVGKGATFHVALPKEPRKKKENG